MKYQNESLGLRGDTKEGLKAVFSQLFANQLVVEGQTVELPEDLDLETKVKFATDEGGNSLTIKISWENVVEEAAD